ncbi:MULTISPECIES: DUF4199 domain-containing protein [Cellulophaga]|uniref:DUF4199 domain-containing protein n=1 Tax=Cellulophaga TaxID=104264 RepID=UPI001C073115|nr:MULTISPECIES: DUF4199 domain-containing protein [Cellulophaga]
MTDNSSNSIKKFVLPIALLFSLGRIILDIISKLAQVGAKMYYATFLIAFVLEVLAIIYLIAGYKKRQGNLINLREALVVGVMFMVIVGSLFAIESYIYDTFIDGEFQKNVAIEWANLYGKGEDVEKMMNDGSGTQKTNAIFSIFTSIIKFSVIGILISFIVGSILRNKK